MQVSYRLHRAFARGHMEEKYRAQRVYNYDETKWK